MLRVRFEINPDNTHTHQIPGQSLLSGGLCFWSSVPVGNLQGLKVPQNVIRVNIRVIFSGYSLKPARLTMNCIDSG